jgi:peroxiredoxin Q/BCP
VKAPLVVFFYPKDSTPGCTLESQDFTRHKEDFAALNCQVIGISQDTVESHCKFIKRFDLGVKLLSDVDGKVWEMFGVLRQKSMFGRKYMGIERSTFLLNADRRVYKIWQPVSILGHAADVLKHLQSMLAKQHQ